MEVELDAAYMDGTTFDIGAIGALKDLSNPSFAMRHVAIIPHIVYILLLINK